MLLGLALAVVLSTRACAATGIPENGGSEATLIAQIVLLVLLGQIIEQPIKTAVRTDIAAEDAILREARLGKHDLIVLGVSRRPGDALSFGATAAALLESSDRSLIFVAPRATVRS